LPATVRDPSVALVEKRLLEDAVAAKSVPVVVALPLMVVEPTEPTNESALQDSADQLALDALSGSDVPAPPPEELTAMGSSKAYRAMRGAP